MYHARKPFNDMTPDEARAYLSGLIVALEKKRARERAYLDRRARRGTHTPTDDAYEADQELETDLLALLNEMLTTLNTL